VYRSGLFFAYVERFRSCGSVGSGGRGQGAGVGERSIFVIRRSSFVIRRSSFVGMVVDAPVRTLTLPRWSPWRYVTALGTLFMGTVATIQTYYAFNGAMVALLRMLLHTKRVMYHGI
jgi:hypothetical protein